MSSFCNICSRTVGIFYRLNALPVCSQQHGIAVETCWQLLYSPPFKLYVTWSLTMTLLIVVTTAILTVCGSLATSRYTSRLAANQYTCAVPLSHQFPTWYSLTWSVMSSTLTCCHVWALLLLQDVNVNFVDVSCREWNAAVSAAVQQWVFVCEYVSVQCC